MPLDDAALLDRWARRRDTDAFNEIVERFAGQVYVTCRRILNNDAEAEDVAQECFLALARSSGEVRSSLGGWLHRVATYKSRDRIRKEVRRRHREHAYHAALPDSVEPTWEDILDHVDEAIEALPEHQRDAVVAHYLGRKSHAVIAAEFGVTRRTVSYRIQHGLEAIRRDLRRRGATVTVAALGVTLAAELPAAPLSLKASLGKLAIAAGAAPGASGATATSSLLGSLIVMNAKSLAFAGMFLVLVAGAYFALTRIQPEAPDKSLAPETTLSSVASEVKPAQTGAFAPRLNAMSAVDSETPSLTDLLALSRGELERALDHYPSIEDPAQYASVSGVVLEQGGYAVPGAVIALVPTHCWATLPGAGEIARTATSDAEGNYRIADIARAGDFRVVASKNGFASEALYVSVEGGKVATVDFTIKNGSTLQGRVVSASGEPVPDAYLYCIGLTGPRQLISDQQRATQADSEGIFTLGFKDEERGFVAALRVQSSKYGSATFPEILVQSDRSVELKLAAPAVIRGTVKDRKGKLLSGARLTFFAQKTIDVTREDSAVWSSPAFAGNFVAISDGSGQYATEVDAGLDFQAKVDVRGFDDGSETMDRIDALTTGETREYNAVFDTDCISVRIALVGQQSGQPFGGYVPVEAIAYNEGKIVAQSQQDGSSALRLTLPGERGSYTFQARYMYDRNVVGNLSRNYKLSGGDDIEIKLDLPDPQSFSVRTVDPGGQPLEGARIEFLLENWGDDPLRYGQTNAEGRLDEPVLLAPLCGARLLVEKTGYATAWGPAYTDQNPGTVHPEEIITLWPGAGFEGNLVNADGDPLANMSISVSIANQNGQIWPIQLTTDVEGHFTVVNQAPADVVDIAIRSDDGDTFSSAAHEIHLEVDSIRDLGTMGPQ